MTNPTLISMLAVAALTTVSINCPAQELSAPVGFNRATCLAGSDTICSVPFDRQPQFEGTLSALTSTGSTATLTPVEGVSWATDQFRDNSFIRIRSGPMNGTYFQITGNSNGQLTIDLAGMDGSSLSEGTRFKICKFWTLDSLFPPSTQSTIIPSTGNLLAQRRTELLLPDNTSPGYNLPPAAIYYLYGTTEWRRSASGFPQAGSTILWPDTYFIIKHGHASITTDTQLITTGHVELGSLTSPLAVLTTDRQDNFVTHGRPVPMPLSKLGLDESTFQSSSSILLPHRRDELYVYDNLIPQLNKPPSFIYYKVGSDWRSASSGSPVSNHVLIPPGSGFIIRKYPIASPSSILWRNDLPGQN
ncbi:TIGR02597 family protein [Verrucomicrobium spinosum]|uniref:TIGR02597 family protein n=1 Tax=Verrucomicrobium spinosum TaxID=2736 RepID=UPI0009D71D47